MLEQLYIGKTAQIERIFTEEDVRISNELSRDVTPLYNQQDAVWSKYYELPIVPALLTEGMISEIISKKLPGRPSILLQKDLVFNSPVHVGQSITAQLIIIDINENRNWITLKVTCSDDNQNEVVKGQVALLLLTNE